MSPVPPKGKSGKKGDPFHMYLDREHGAFLDAIGEAMGKRRLGVSANRSQLISSAIRNFIEDCKVEEDLKEAIREASEIMRETRSELEAPNGGDPG